MRRELLAAVVAAAAATAVGCSSVQQGLVEAKTHDAAYVYTTIIPMSCGNGCMSMIPIVTNVPECWRLDLRDGEERGSVCVDQPVWDDVDPGQRYQPPREQP